MKYIKNFNEELKPETYRNASSKFLYYDKEEKSNKLSDWADLKEFGFYNMHFANNSGSILENSSFTKPELMGIYYTMPGRISGESVTQENLLNAKGDYIEEKANKLVKDWTDGKSELCICFEFGFKATRESIIKSNNHSYLRTGYLKRGSRYSYQVPAFTICLELSEWHEGIEEYDSDAKWEAERGNYEFIPTSTHDLYEWTQYIQWSILKPYDDHYFMILSDRSSAQKFRNFLVQTLNLDVVKDRIMEVLRIINCSAENLENIFKSFNSIKIHGLYDEKVPRSKIADKWFGKRIDY